jgi:hypothetical protein
MYKDPSHTRADDMWHYLTTWGNKWTGEEHLPSQTEREINSIAYTGEKAGPQVFVKWNNIAYNAFIVVLGVAVLTTFV